MQLNPGGIVDKLATLPVVFERGLVHTQHALRDAPDAYDLITQMEINKFIVYFSSMPLAVC